MGPEQRQGMAFLDLPGCNAALFEPSGALLTNGAGRPVALARPGRAGVAWIAAARPTARLAVPGPAVRWRAAERPGNRERSIPGRRGAARRPPGPAGAARTARRCAVCGRQPRRPNGGHGQPFGGTGVKIWEAGAANSSRSCPSDCSAGRLQSRWKMAGDDTGAGSACGPSVRGRKGPRSAAPACLPSPPTASCWRRKRVRVGAAGRSEHGPGIRPVGRPQPGPRLD